MENFVLKHAVLVQLRLQEILDARGEEVVGGVVLDRVQVRRQESLPAGADQAMGVWSWGQGLRRAAADHHRMEGPEPVPRETTVQQDGAALPWACGAPHWPGSGQPYGSVYYVAWLVTLLAAVMKIAAHMVGLQEHMKGPRYDVFGPWPVSPPHIAAQFA